MSSKASRYGTWPSPVSSSLITSDSVSLDELRLQGTTAYWVEKRPLEKGRCVIVRHSNGRTTDILPPSYNARSRVHEYGGGVYCLADSGLFFVNDDDQNIYFAGDDQTPVAITHTDDTAYADLQYDSQNKLIICICQHHRGEHEAKNSLIAVDPADGSHYTLHAGHDFYSSPRLSPCGARLCWLCWDHPDMPWDSTQLWLAELEDKQLHNPQRIGQADTNNVSIFQPEWSPGGTLYFISDRSGWWNLYRYHDQAIDPLTMLEEEFGRPQWVFAQSAYAFLDDARIVCAPITEGITRLKLLDTASGKLASIDARWSSINSLQAGADSCWFIAASERSFPEVIQLDHATKKHQVIRSSCTLDIDPNYYAHGQVIKFKTRHHDAAYAIYYQPSNIDVVADADEKPPMIILTHGGPTAMADPSLDLKKQYWTSRGFAILDVNYSGSTGFGRAYRERLNGNWGIRDAEDCCDAAMHMVSLGLADAQRLIIKGSSAGGYTVLCALTFHDVFAAGASYYGIGSLESLLQDTHKFESRYLDRLVGPYPEQKTRYQQRSPLNHVEQLNCPVIFFQGTEDRVVPMAQAEKMYSALKQRGVPVSCILFPGEQHGFRKAETIQAAIDTEYAFYAKLFALDVDNTVPVEIDNLET